MLKLIPWEGAAELLQSQAFTVHTETVPLEEAHDRVLAEEIRAAFPMPPFDKSPFDGFAFRAEETPGTLKIEGEAAAGCRILEPLAPGTAMRIFTGAPVPEGANAVLKAEDTQVKDGSVTIPMTVRPDSNIIRIGEEYPSGIPLLKAGVRIGPAELGVLASQGLASVPVFRKPKVLFLSTGTELSLPGEERSRYGIYNSSFYTLSAYLRRMGFSVLSGGTVPDDLDRIIGKIREGLLGDADLVITTGGASVGDYDYAVRAAETLGLEILFWKVNVKPGGALMAAKTGEKLLLGLSGNPAAAIMSLLTVLQPCLRKRTGEKTGSEELILPIKEDMPKFSTAVRMLRGHGTVRDGVLYFEENAGRGNGHISSFTDCDMIGIVEGGQGHLPAGTKIRVLRLPRDLC